MEIKLSMILEHISLLNVNFISGEQNPGFQHVKLMSDLIDTPACDTIYVATENQLNYCQLFSFKPYVLCIPDKLPFDSSNCIKENTVYFTERISLHELFFRVNEFFDRLNAWDFRLYKSTLNDEGLQALLDISEGIFKNHIHIVEPFSSLLAYSKNIDIEEIDLGDMYTKNLEIPETMMELQKLLNTKVQFSQNDIIYVEKNSFFIHPFITKKVSQDGTYNIYVIMICQNSPFTDGLKELLLHFCKYVSYYTKKMNRTKSFTSHEIFFNGILNNNFSQNALNIHATLTLKLPLRSNYNLYTIAFKKDPTCQKELLEKLFISLPNARLACYEQYILILNHYTHKDMKQEHLSNIESIRKIIKLYNCVCGISNPFKNLCDLLHAYYQTTVALQFSQKNNVPFFPFISSSDDEIFYYYDHFSISNTLLETGKIDPEMNSLAPYIDNISIIHQYDHVQSTKCLHFLFIYLTSERNIATVCEILQLKKEKVLEYIDILEHLLFVDLNSWKIRVKLLLAFEYLNLNPISILVDKKS